MNDWEELKELMQRLPRGSDQYNQIVGDAVVAVDRKIVQLEAENQRLMEALVEAEQMLEMTAFGSSALDTVKDALKDGE